MNLGCADGAASGYNRGTVGPIAFVIVFMLVPLAAALFAGGFFAAVGIMRVVGAVPTGAWAALAVSGVLALAARLWIVVRGLLSDPRQT